MGRCLLSLLSCHLTADQRHNSACVEGVGCVEGLDSTSSQFMSILRFLHWKREGEKESEGEGENNGILEASL